MLETSANHDFLSLCIETKDKSSVVIAPTSFDVAPESRTILGRYDGGVIYAQIKFETSRCSGRVFEVFTPDFFHRLRNALSELIQGKDSQVATGGLEGFFLLELNRDNDEGQVVCRITMPGATRGETSSCSYYLTSSYPGSMRTFVELELWLDESMMRRMLTDCESLISRIKELSGGWQQRLTHA